MHGDVVTICESGILMSPDAAKSIGIYNGSICYGIWVADTNKKARPGRHLVISPIHPRSWPFLLRLRLFICAERGSLALACKFLSEKKFSILFQECAASGFSHATLAVIAEPSQEDDKSLVSKLVAEKNLLDGKARHPRIEGEWKNRSDKDLPKRFKSWFDQATDLGKKLAEELKDALKEENNKQREEKDPNNFFYPNAGRDAPKEGDNAEAEDPEGSDERVALLDIYSPPFDVQWMPRLAFHAAYGGSASSPFAFRYDSERAMLLHVGREPGESFANDGELPGDELPMEATIALHPRDKYLRIHPIRASEVEKFVRIEAEYEVPADGGRGLLVAVCDEIQALGIELSYSTNKWTQFGHAQSRALIELFGRFTGGGERPVYDAKALQSVLKHLDVSVVPGAKLKRVVVEPHPHRRLFLSRRYGHPRDENLLRMAREVAASFGFKIVNPETYSCGVTNKVVEFMNSCDAFLQLLLLSENDDPDRANFPWLQFELGLATARKIPMVRMIDTSICNAQWWEHKTKIFRDTPFLPFRSDANRKRVRKALRAAMGQLAGALPPSEASNI